VSHAEPSQRRRRGDPIHKAADQPSGFGSEQPAFVLARDGQELVGVIIFGLEHPDDPVATASRLESPRQASARASVWS
jgi:hypothetical protein